MNTIDRIDIRAGRDLVRASGPTPEVVLFHATRNETVGLVATQCRGEFSPIHKGLGHVLKGKGHQSLLSTGARGTASASELPRPEILEAARERGTGKNPGETQFTLPSSLLCCPVTPETGPGGPRVWPST